jgi:hypothetical protein
MEPELQPLSHGLLELRLILQGIYTLGIKAIVWFGKLHQVEW